MPKEQETKKSKKKKEVEIDPEILEAQRQARMKAEEIATYGRMWIWEEFWDESNAEIQNAWT